MCACVVVVLSTCDACVCACVRRCLQRLDRRYPLSLNQMWACLTPLACGWPGLSGPPFLPSRGYHWSVATVPLCPPCVHARCNLCHGAATFRHFELTCVCGCLCVCVCVCVVPTGYTPLSLCVSTTVSKLLSALKAQVGDHTGPLAVSDVWQLQWGIAFPAKPKGKW